MKNGKLLFKTIIFFILLLNIAYGSNSFPKKKTIDVALMFRLYDKYNTTVDAMITGIQTAKTMFEQEHPNVTIKLHMYSHDEDLASVAKTTDQIIKDKIPMVIGGELSSEAMIISEKLNNHKIVFITPTSSSPLVVTQKPFSFSGSVSDDILANQLAKYVALQLKPTALGIIRDVSSPYSNGLTEKFLKSLNQIQAKEKIASMPVYEEKILMNTVDFNSQIHNFIKNKVTHVIMLDYQVDFFPFVIQAEKQQFHPVYVGSDGWGSNEMIYKTLVLNRYKNFIAYRNSYWREDVSNQFVARFKDEYSKQYKKSPNAWSAMAFDSAWLLFTGADRASDSKNANDIKNQLEKIKNINLVTTTKFSFSQGHSAQKDLFIYRINGDGAHFATTLQ